jgi:neutral ceramidase
MRQSFPTSNSINHDQMNHQIFQAGAAQVDITPPLGTVINGDFIPHHAHTIHDPLYAKALVMSGASTTLVLVIVDICAMRKTLIDEVKAQIRERSGIDPANILISATHTHASGSVESLLMVEADLAYRKKLPGLIVDAVLKAQHNLRPAKVGFGSADAPEHVVCRRFYMKEGYIARNPVTGGTDTVKTNPFGDEKQIDRRVSRMDTEVAFIAVRGLDDQWISILGNYCMHYAGDWENGTITADYFGVFSRRIKEKINAGDDFVGMMSNGTSGEANIWDFLDPDRYPKEFFAKSEIIGNDLAGKVAKALDDIQWDSSPKLSAAYGEVPVRLRKPRSDELEAARGIVATARYENLLKIDSESLQQIYAREQVLLNEFPGHKVSPVQAMRIGQGVIGGLGGEFFAETGLRLKKDSAAKNYFTICFANDYVGYVPPAHEIEAGGYETWRCRTSHLVPDTESKIREALVELMNAVSG